MSVAGVAMAKRNDTAVKVDQELVTLAKMVAASRMITLAEYLSEALRPIITKDFETEMTKRSKPARKPKG